MTDEEYYLLKKKVMSLTGIDLDHYKSQQMRRRLAFFVEKTNALDIGAYCRKIENDADCLKKLRDYLTINVTEFFRDVWAWKELENNVLPALAKSKRSLRVWSAGCSNGGEAYTLAILLLQAAGSGHHQILATDVDEHSLALGVAGGPYGPEAIKGVPANYLQQFFTSAADGYRVKPQIGNMVSFRRHNMLSEPFERGFDLVCCRNVTIYFTEDAKNRLNRQIYDSLNDDGVLFIGATEFIQNPAAIGFNKLSNCFYQKVAGPFASSQQKEELLIHIARR